MSQAAAVTTSAFQSDVLQSEVPVLVDFWAAWCGPCRMIGPHVDAISEEFSGKAKVFKVDVDAEGDLAEQYRVHSIPSLIFFKGGQEVERLVGVVNKKVIAEKLEALV
jgi:thioredoxin 1